jgi:thymidylate synthase ThyX
VLFGKVKLLGILVGMNTQDNTDTKKQEIANLKHYSSKLPWGGEVVVLETGAIITAEDTAMIQALHSRDPKGIHSHLEKLAKSGSGKMMESFYVGYGHKSIGDCASTTIFIEGCSMLAAKAIQQSALYNGQECSTRYINFTDQPFLDGSDLTTEKKDLHEKLRNFYVTAFPQMVEYLKQINPINEGEDIKMYDKAINARAFDILRGFLPAGATTNVAWTGTLRSIADRLTQLRHYPLKEVQVIAEHVQSCLEQAHPHSFGFKKYEGTENYNKSVMEEVYFEEGEAVTNEVRLDFDGVDRTFLEKYKKFFENRPAKTELPKMFGITGNSRISFLLDFGSWRDLQRHRSLIQLMPLLDTKHGFHSWYIERLSPELQMAAKELLGEIEKGTANMSPMEKQYYLPMGYKIPVILSGDLSALIYTIELRATSFVHETLQVKAIEMADLLEKTYGLKLHVNREDVGRFNIKRGNQDIVEKK